MSLLLLLLDVTHSLLTALIILGGASRVGELAAELIKWRTKK